MKKFVLIAIITLVLGFGMNACNETIKGNGNITEEQYALDDFSTLEINGMFQIMLEKGNPGYKLLIDENLHEHVTHEQNGSEVTIGVEDKFLDADTAVLVVYFDHLSELELNGAAQLNASHTFTDRFEVEVSGASEMDLGLDAKLFDLELRGGGEITLHGKVDQMNIEIAGAANVSAFELESKRTSISITGAGEIETWTTKELDVKVTGAGEVEYLGDPKINQNITGAGEVKRSDKKNSTAV